jgi:hypothetical protein
MSKIAKAAIVGVLSYAGFVAFATTARAGDLGAMAACCSSGEGCPGLKLCCDPAKMGADPCDTNMGQLGYCKDTCPKGPGGGE